MRIATAHPERVRGLIVQNSNAYADGLGAGFKPLVDYWTTPSNPAFEATARSLLPVDVTRDVFYKTGVRQPDAIPPEAWIYDQVRPGALRWLHRVRRLLGMRAGS